MKCNLLAAFLLATVATASAQVVSYTPAYPTIDDTVTITFDASQGNAALAGVSPVFAHTGVINRYSTDAGDWAHQVSEWTSGYDSVIAMTPLGGNLHEISFKPRSFYGISSTEGARALAFVLRNETGTLAGKNADGTDIYVPLYASTGFSALFAAPIERDPILSLGASLPIRVKANQPALITIFQDGIPLAQSSGLVQDFSTSLSASSYGKFNISFSADNGTTTLHDTIFYLVQPPVGIAPLPAGIRDGINYVDDTTVVLVLQAPGKSYVYAIGDFSDWEMDPAYMMQRTPDGGRYWVEITGLNPGQEYRFQYFVDHVVKTGDPYAEKVLDPFNDQGVNSVIYPNLIPYPQGETSELVTVFQTGKPEYNWQVTNFQRPDSRDLVVYELLVRDFVARHDYGTLIDTLDYLQRLGVNALEIMPVNEFDGNQSWGYGPAYYFAPDKYYGTELKLKQFVDECHQRGIAVIFDVVFNHCFGQAPHLRLYQDRNTLLPTANNPWLNIESTHPYSPGYDFNHESGYTQMFFDSVLSYYAREYHVDGFRFDLSKGFTQTFTGQDIGAWSAYDLSRINNLKRLANRYWQYNGGAYLVLEHFADNSEETELANFGYMFWGKATVQYEQAAMGYESNSDFSFYISHQHRGWAFHNLLGFMESHDEERLMFKCLQYGNTTNPAHNVRDTTVALKRMGMVAAFWACVPGPKMMWQFGELGYDVSIDVPCRTCPKPIRWNYYQDARRQYLYKTYAALIHLKTQHPNTFRSGSYDISAWGKQKQIHVNENSMNVTLIGNFDVYHQDTWTGFQHTGRWYDYMSGDSLDVTDVNMTVSLQPGDWRLFTDQRLPKPDLSIDPVSTAVNEPLGRNLYGVTVSPNPSSGPFEFRFDLPKAAEVRLEVYDIQGRSLAVQDAGKMGHGEQVLRWDGGSLPDGHYLYRLRIGADYSAGRITVQGD